MNPLTLKAISYAIGGYMTLVGGSKTAAELDQCERILTAAYEQCLARGSLKDFCARTVTTRDCGYRWGEAYFTFLDRRIEENAAKHPDRRNFTGLSKLEPWK
jgi:hypothetical protein